jgi:hypothetical protein
VKVFVFDLLAYGENLEHLKQGAELPWPLAKRHFKPEVAVRTYAEHLDAWAELDKLGYDGVGFNEHHTSPYGLMNSPNLLAASAAQRTKNLKLLIYGNLLPIHEPLRLAEELAMLDCLSNGRIISGFARGIPREHNVYNVPQSESRARFEEAWQIIRGLWTEDVFSYEGQFWSYKDVALWPRPVHSGSRPSPGWTLNGPRIACWRRLHSKSCRAPRHSFTAFEPRPPPRHCRGALAPDFVGGFDDQLQLALLFVPAEHVASFDGGEAALRRKCQVFKWHIFRCLVDASAQIVR